MPSTPLISHMRHKRLSNKWLAGLFDADSSMSVARLQGVPYARVSFSQLDPGVVDAVHHRYGGSQVRSGARKIKTLHWTGNTTLKILAPLFPYLVVREFRALMLMLLQSYSGRPQTAEKTADRQRVCESLKAYTGRASYHGASMPIQWLAGFVEGDGSITVGGKIPLPLLAIAQKDNRVLLAIQKRYQGRLNGPDSNECWFLNWNGKKAIALLTRLQPHLMFKYNQARFAIEMSEHIGPGGKKVTPEQLYERNWLADRIKELNHVNRRRT